MEEFSVSIFWENKREEVIEVTPGHMRVSMEELGLKQQSCFQIPAGSITCASLMMSESPPRNTAFMKGMGRVEVYILL